MLSQRVYGYVHDQDGAPIANETVLFTSMSNDSTMSGKSYTTITNSAGYYQVNMTYGQLKAHVDKQGYIPVDDSISLNQSEVLLYNFTLAQQDQTVTPNATTTAGGSTDNTIMYVVLGIVNLVALLLIGFIVLRTRK